MVSYMTISSVVTQLSSPQEAAENRICEADYCLYESVLICELPWKTIHITLFNLHSV